MLGAGSGLKHWNLLRERDEDELATPEVQSEPITKSFQILGNV